MEVSAGAYVGVTHPKFGTTPYLGSGTTRPAGAYHGGGMDPFRLRRAVDRAVDFLAASQEPHGELAGRLYGDAGLTAPGTPDSSPFVTTFAVYALSFAGPRAAAAAAKGLGFLLEQREPGGLWRYWSSRNPRRIDPDLDDTCCAAFLVARLAPSLHDASAEAAILANRTKDGLFRTWVRAPEAKNDVDAAVNANVLLYLGAHEAGQRAALALNRTMAGGTDLYCHYYVDPLALDYMVARAFAHGAAGLSASRPAILHRLTEADEATASPLQTALACCTRLNLDAGGAALERGLERLLDAQGPDGAWPRAAFYCGPEPPTRPRAWWGSEELTTAFALEALAKALQHRA